VTHFIDFEASSLCAGSFPIEVAWVNERGDGETHLIKPAPGWTEWDPASERIHGIPLAILQAQGEDFREVAKRAAEVLHPDRTSVISDNPPFDQYWLEMLMTTAGCSPVPRMLKAVTVNVEECRALEEMVDKDLPARVQYDLLRQARDQADYIIGSAEEAHEKEHVHRALPDATQLWRVWMDVRSAVRREVEIARAARPRGLPDTFGS
jgi:DNA polymerase III epsilon subunit-like protein